MSGSVHAQDSAVADIFKDGFYGGLAGALVGAAALLIDIEDADDHLDYIAIGAGAGIIAGTAYGIYSTIQTVAMTEIQHSQIAWRFPVPQITRVRSALIDQEQEIQYRVPLLRVHF
jgi:hypothetical protein